MRLIYTDVSFLNDDALFAENCARLSAYRQEKVNTFRLRKDKNLSLGAGLLLDYALSPYGLREQDMRYGAGENGKPFFKNAPTLHFSLSHSGTKALLALGDSEVGCDAEEITAADLKIAARFFHPEEYAALLAAPADRQNEAFFRLWTLKESFIKMTGDGLGVPLSGFCIRRQPDGITADRPSFDKTVFFAEYDDIPGYCVSLCTTGHPERPPLECIRLPYGKLKE